MRFPIWAVGLEPTRDFSQRLLRPLRLPITPCPLSVPPRGLCVLLFNCQRAANADDRSRTCTPKNQILSLARLPIPPRPLHMNQKAALALRACLYGSFTHCCANHGLLLIRDPDSHIAPEGFEPSCPFHRTPAFEAGMSASSITGLYFINASLVFLLTHILGLYCGFPKI